MPDGAISLALTSRIWRKGRKCAAPHAFPSFFLRGAHLHPQQKKKDEKASAIEFLKRLDEVYERKQADEELTKEDEILYTFRRLLKEWELDLSERSEPEKRTAQV